MASPKKISDYVPILKDQGVDHLAGAHKPGVTLQSTVAEQAGDAPWSVTFAGLGLKDMADAEYAVFVEGPNGDERADLSSRTERGFDIVGGANTELMSILVVGRLAGQTA